MLGKIFVALAITMIAVNTVMAGKLDLIFDFFDDRMEELFRAHTIHNGEKRVRIVELTKATIENNRRIGHYTREDREILLLTQPFQRDYINCLYRITDFEEAVKFRANAPYGIQFTNMTRDNLTKLIHACIFVMYSADIAPLVRDNNIYRVVTDNAIACAMQEAIIGSGHIDLTDVAKSKPLLRELVDRTVGKLVDFLNQDFLYSPLSKHSDVSDSREALVSIFKDTLYKELGIHATHMTPESSGEDSTNNEEHDG